MANYLILEGQQRIGPLMLARLLNGMTHGQLAFFIGEVAAELVVMDDMAAKLIGDTFDRVVSAHAMSAQSQDTKQGDAKGEDANG